MIIRILMPSVLAGASLLVSGCGPTGGSSSNMSASIVDAVPIAFGKSGEVSDVTFTVKSVEQRARIGAAGYGSKVEAGETFVVVRYAIKNVGKEPLSGFNKPGLEMVDGAGQAYAEDTQAGIMASALNDDLLQSSGDLNPGVSAKGTAVWKVAKSSFDKKAWRVKVTFGGLGAQIDKAVTWPLNDASPPPMLFNLQ